MTVSPFGKLLADLRQQQPKWTQERLADCSKVSVRTIGRLETGKLREPRPDTARALATALAAKPGIAPADCQRLMRAFGDTPGITEPVTGPVTGPATEPVTDDEPTDRIPWDASDHAATQLAREVRARWKREAEHQGIHDPVALPVRWGPAPKELMDSWPNIHRLKVAPGATASPVDLAGALDDIAVVLRRVPSGRLVVLGRAGSGKTILTLRFVMDHIAARRAATDPVPVIFGIGSWDPTAVGLRDWLIERLLRDHPHLDADGMAATLVDEDRVLPVLDGFDEIAPGLRAAALKQLNNTDLPLLLTSRVEQYAEAVAETSVLTAAAAVELTDLTAADLAGYLPRTTRGARWAPVLDRLRDQPDRGASRNLTRVLSTPLMITLARTVYGDVADRDPTELLDVVRFPTPKEIEDHLLATFVPTVYRPRPSRRDWDPDRVRRWLGHLARHLDRLDTHDLAWWQLGTAMRRSVRIITVVVATTLITAAADWLVFTPVYMSTYGASTGVRAALLEGGLAGPAVGLGFGLVYALMAVFGGIAFEPSRVQVRLLGGHRRGVRRPYASGFGVGLLGGFVVGLGFGPATTVFRGLIEGFPPGSTVAVIQMTLVNTLVTGTIFGLAAGVVFGLMAALETPLDVGAAAGPLSLLRTSRTTVTRQVAVLAPMFTLVIGFGGELVVTLLDPFFGPLTWGFPGGLLVGLVGGIGGSVSYALAFTAWGQWLLLARLWWPLTGRAPWSIITFLDDAYDRGVLRQAGAVYQFRHDRLQHHLSRAR